MLNYLSSFKRDQHEQDVFKPVTLDFSLKTSGTKSLGYKQCSVLREPHFLWLINSPIAIQFPALSRRPVCQETLREQESRSSPAEPRILMNLLKYSYPPRPTKHLMATGGKHDQQMFITTPPCKHTRDPRGHIRSSKRVMFS